MGLRELLRWQWSLYAGTHRNRVNLLLHLCTVPFFWAGTVLLAIAAADLNLALLTLGAGSVLVALVAQGRGHKLESEAPAPFSSPWNFMARLLLEQWITFPHFVLSGGWWSNFRQIGL